MKIIRTFRIIVLIDLYLFLYVSADAQEKVTFKQAAYDYKSDQIIKIYEKSGNVYMIENGPYKDYPTVDHYNIIRFPNGFEKELKKNEFIEGIMGEHLFTCTYNYITNVTDVSLYLLTLGNLSFVKKIEFNGEQKVTIHKSTILISDQYEQYGTSINIYDNQLQLLNQINPFENGFEQSVSTSLGNNIIIIAKQSGPNNNFKYIELNSNTGIITFEKLLQNLNIDIVRLIPVGTKIIAVDPFKIIAIEAGNISWERMVTLPNYDILANEALNAIFYCSKNEIFQISAEDGRLLSVVGFPTSPSNKIESEKCMIRPVVFKEIPGRTETVILFAEADPGILSCTSLKKNAKLFFIDKKGSLNEIHKSSLSQFMWADIIEKADHRLILITDNQQIELQ